MDATEKILNKYPRDNADGYSGGRMFIMPRAEIRDSGLTQMDIVVLALISSLTKTKVKDITSVETDFVNIDYLIVVSGLSRKYKSDILQSIENLKEYGLLTEEKDEDFGMSIFQVILDTGTKSYMKVSKDEFVKLCKMKNSKTKLNCMFMFILLNTYMFKTNGKDETFVTWVGNKTLSREMNLSERTIQRVLQQLEEECFIARYTVTMSNGFNFYRRHLISCYYDRHMLRNHLEDNLSTEDNKRKYGTLVS